MKFVLNQLQFYFPGPSRFFSSIVTQGCHKSTSGEEIVEIKFMTLYVTVRSDNISYFIDQAKSQIEHLHSSQYIFACGMNIHLQNIGTRFYSQNGLVYIR